MAAISRAIEPHWVLANTAGGGLDAAGIAAGSAAVFEEFLLRPLQANWSEVGDAVEPHQCSARHRAARRTWSSTRTRREARRPTAARKLAALAYYYLVADPERTFLMFFGGYEPRFDVGRSTGRRPRP